MERLSSKTHGGKKRGMFSRRNDTGKITVTLNLLIIIIIIISFYHSGARFVRFSALQLICVFMTTVGCFSQSVQIKIDATKNKSPSLFNRDGTLKNHK